MAAGLIKIVFLSNIKISVIQRGRSSVGRAPALQAGGQEFESLRLHLPNEKDLGRR